MKEHSKHHYLLCSFGLIIEPMHINCDCFDLNLPWLALIEVFVTWLFLSSYSSKVLAKITTINLYYSHKVCYTLDELYFIMNHLEKLFMKFNGILCYFYPHFIPFGEGFVPTSVRNSEVTPERLFL